LTEEGYSSHGTRTCRTLFGTITRTRPRLPHCRCQPRKTIIFRPLNALVTEAVAAELLFIEAKGASRVSAGLTAQALKDFLPVDATLNATTVQKLGAVFQQWYPDLQPEEEPLAA
jgi:hypothetical protein